MLPQLNSLQYVWTAIFATGVANKTTFRSNQYKIRMFGLSSSSNRDKIDRIDQLGPPIFLEFPEETAYLAASFRN
jgi:hypothetical protein